jgi:cell division transport system permease protein
MSLSYTLKESISGFQRAKLSSFISIITVSIALLLLGIFSIVTLRTSRLIDSLRSKVEMEAFLEEPFGRKERVELEKRVLAIEGVERVEYISKEQAAQIFKNEFGEDISAVLDFNPLPPSFKIYLKKENQTADGAGKIHDKLMDTRGIQTVKYWKELLDVLDRRTTAFYDVTLGLGIVIGLSAIFLVSNTIRLAIYAKRKLIRTMELVGATTAFIRFPFLLEGFIQGFCGGVIASGIFYVMTEYSARLLSKEFSEFIHMDPMFYLLVVGGGTALGLIGSSISVVRFIRFSQMA